MDIDTITDRLLSALTQNKQTVFVKIPTVDAPEWPKHIKARFFREVQGAKKWHECGPEQDWIYFEMTGTTPSGHATRTTLGNTLRALLYAWYYQKKSGISDTPWNSDKVFTICSGDDCVMFCEPEFEEALVDAIRNHSSRDMKPSFIGLGQCIKEINTGRFYEIEFCSKWSWSVDGTLEGWHMCRNVEKIFKTK